MSIHILGQSKKKMICEFCGRHAHPFNIRCDYNDLKSRIKNLMDRNSLIPHLTRQNRDLSEIGLTFQHQFDRVTQALIICEEVIKEEITGTAIWNKFEERLEAKWEKTTPQDINEKLKILSQESIIPSETESNPCTVETTPGEIIAPDSLQ